jgi:hypothetical protein
MCREADRTVVTIFFFYSRPTQLITRVKRRTHEIRHAILIISSINRPKNLRGEAIHKDRVNSALEHGRSNQLHEPILAQMDVHVRRRRHLNSVGVLQLHLGLIFK